jgi:tRNA dimethylallyltransferase
VEKLVNMGYDFNLPAMSSIGYKQIGQFLKGELTLAYALQQIKFETHRFVRHQYTWFRLKDDRIHWLDISGQVDAESKTTLAKFIRRGN